MALALFDLDNTLLHGDSDHLWGEFMCQIGAVDSVEYRQQNDQFYADYQAGNLDIYAYNEFCLQPLTKYSLEQLQQWRTQFLYEIIVPTILPHGQEKIAKHRHADDQIVIITATNEFITKPIAKHMNITTLLATTPEVIEGRYTGKVAGTPCFREGKVARLNAWLRNSNYDLSGSYFYSDSVNDLPLLELVQNPIAVDPDEKLRQYAEQNEWPVISFRLASQNIA